MMRRYTFIILVCFILASLAACAPSSATIPPAAYQAVPFKSDPQITFNTTTPTLLIDVISPTGIGSATIQKTAGQWPGQIVMRLHLKGLENFKFRYAETNIELSVSSHGDQAVHETYSQAGQSGEVKVGEPYWIAVTPGAGYFDLVAPADFLKSGEDQFTIEWVDFYR